MSPDDDPRIDELRDQLRALGYLNAGVTRFVLAGAGGRRRPAALAAAASLRVGALAGLCLGPAAAIGLRARLPGLVTSTSDAIVIAAYLALIFGAGAAVLAFVLSLAAGWAARRSRLRDDFSARARRAIVLAGVLAGLGCLVYLTLWWRSVAGAGGGASLFWTASVLGVAVAISVLIAQTVIATTSAFIARLGFGSALRPGLPLSSWRSLLVLGVVAFGGAAALLVAAAPPNSLPDAPPLVVVPTGQRVLVVGMDGIDPATLDRLRASGQLPRLNRLLSQSVATLPGRADPNPVRDWTTIATGQPPERHGIETLDSRELAGLDGRLPVASRSVSLLTTATDVLRLTKPAMATSEERRVPAFWEVAARAGLRTAVVDWWATWPAPADLGIVLSDRALLRLDRGGPLDGEIAPPALYDALRATWPSRVARVHALAAQVATPGLPDAAASSVSRAAIIDASVIDLAESQALGPLDLLAVYLPGLDVAQDALFTRADGSQSPAGLAARVAALERYYVFLDGLVGELVDRWPTDGGLVVLVTQPGRVTTGADGRLAIAGRASDGLHATVPATSVAPTILYALGVPIATDLSSAPAMNLFSAPFQASDHERAVTTYGARLPRTHAAAGKTLDKEMLERMKSLGYIR